jgi:Icc-related predicted phosphoesterase
MHLLALSDWHVQNIEILFDILDDANRPFDIIVYAGDGIGRFLTQDRNKLSELAAKTTLGKVLAIRGNDDELYSIDTHSGREALDFDVFSGKGIIDLHDEPVIIDDYGFMGIEGAPMPGPGLAYSEMEIKSHLENQYKLIGNKIPVLVSHAPPFGTLDIAIRMGQRHIGSKSIKSFIENVKPLLTVCGHVHLYGGQAVEQKFGTVINISSHDKPGSEGNYADIKLDNHNITYELKNTTDGANHRLYNLSQVGARRIKHFLEIGITELEQFTQKKNHADLLSLPGVYQWHVDMWYTEVHAILNEEFVLLDENELEFLKNDELVLLDIETDLNQGKIWLIGIYQYHNDEFNQFYNKDNEYQLIMSFIDFLKNQNESTIVYYGNNYFDEKCLKQRCVRWDRHEIFDLMSESYDLGILLQTNLLGEYNDINLKNLAPIIGDFNYENTELTGFQVGSLYTNYLLDGREPDWEKLMNYNKDDVYALKSIVDNIRNILNTSS